MAYVPGYEHDVFVSYAHGDERPWIDRFVDRLESAVKQRLGFKPQIWIDDEDLPQSADFRREIPASLDASAVFLALASPSYIRSSYCVEDECQRFERSIAGRRDAFSASFANENFALRCVLLPVDDNEHWSLLPGLTDIPFCNESTTFEIGSQEFDAAFRSVLDALVTLLKRMRNDRTAAFLYPRDPSPDVRAAHTLLAAQLSKDGFRILPDRNVKIEEQLRGSALSVFLLGAQYDDDARRFAKIAAEGGRPWVVWRSAAAEQTQVTDQSGFCAYLEQLQSPTKTFLNASILPEKLKEEVLGLLRPDPRALPATHGKPRVYLIYNARERDEIRNAGLITFHFRDDVHFEHPDDPTQHAARLAGSDGVLLVWGHAEEAWCSREFEEMIQSPRRADARQGLCLFDPSAPKTEAVRQIRAGFSNLYIGEQFGAFDPNRLSPFFTPLLRQQNGGRP